MSPKPVKRPDQVKKAVPWMPQHGPQEKAIRASFVYELLYGGGRGSGKSDYLLGDFGADVNTYGENWRGILFRRTYPELDELIERSKQIYYAAFPGSIYRVGSRTWIFPSGAQLRLRHLESEGDADRYQGHQYSWIGQDEVTQWPTLRAYHKLKACLRVGSESIPHKRIRCTGNPGGPGHNAVKSYFVDVAPESTLYTDPDTGDTRMYIRGLVQDNHILMRNDPTYVNRLRGVGDEALVKAWLNGDWDVFVGQYFANWRHEEIVEESFDIPESWPLLGGMDYGEAAPTAFGLYTVDFDGIIHRICEYYVKNRSATQHAKAILSMIQSCPFTGGRLPSTIWVDPSMFTRRRLQDNVQSSAADVFQEHGLFLTAANNDRVNGWRLINDALIKGKLKAFKGWNTSFFKTVPSLPRDPKNPEDVDSEAEDHQGDELRYLMAHAYKPAKAGPAPNRDRRLGANVLKSLTTQTGTRRKKVV